MMGGSATYTTRSFPLCFAVRPVHNGDMEQWSRASSRYRIKIRMQGPVGVKPTVLVRARSGQVREVSVRTVVGDRDASGCQ